MTINELYSIYKTYPTITIDSRNCPKDSLFFALKGDNFNGNFFAEKAIENGCRYAIIDDASLQKDERYILVENVLQTLRNLAKHHRCQLAIPVIGITGTNGKTTTKELISAVLNQKYTTLYTQGNLNNHIGVPLTILKISDKHKIAVIEMGANHPGEIKDSVDLAQPDFGIITNVGKAHLEGFGSFEGVVKTKGELYDFLRLNGGKIFINKNNLHLLKIAEGLDCSDYGLENPESDVWGKVTECSPFVKLEWRAKGNPSTQKINTHFIGDYNAENMLAAICIGRYFDVPDQKINEAIENYLPQNNRSQLSKTDHNELIIDTYNANPTSMEAALRNFAKMNFKHKTVLLGDMLELGEQSVEEHQKILDLVKNSHFENVFLVGRQFSELHVDYPSFLNIGAFIDYLEKNPINGNCVLIKGSHGIQLEKAIDKF